MIKSIAAYLDLDDESKFHESKKQLIEKHDAREDVSEKSYKKELINLFANDDDCKVCLIPFNKTVNAKET